MNRLTLTSLALLLLRVGIGCMMLVHGYQKIAGYADMSEKFPDPLGVSSAVSLNLTIAAEVGCSILLIIGLATRLAAIPLGFTMIVALWIIHKGDPWQKQELAAIYLLIYSTILIAGPGTFSIDHLFVRRRRKPVVIIGEN